MPWREWHSARITEPSDQKYERYRFVTDPKDFPAGVGVNYGIRRGDGKSEVQAIRFRPDAWTPKRAKKWLADQGYRIIDFEEAKPADGETVKRSMPACPVGRIEAARQAGYDRGLTEGRAAAEADRASAAAAFLKEWAESP